MRLRAKIGILATAVIVAAGLALGFMPRAVPVDVAEVKRAPLTVTVEEEGKTRVRERYTVSAPVAGYVRRIELKAGDAVAAGQVLALIEPLRSDALDPRSRAQAQAQASAAQAALSAAQENARAAAAAAQLRSRSVPAPNRCGNRISSRRRRSIARAPPKPAPAPPRPPRSTRCGWRVLIWRRRAPP